MDPTIESSLLAKLESSEYKGLYQRYSDFLKPFTDVVQINDETSSKKPKKNQKSKKGNEAELTVIRTFAKRFLPFLNRSVSLLPKRLLESPKPGGEEEDWVIELFDTYKFCLDCLSCMASQLAGKPYAIQLQRLNLVHCFEAWKLYAEAESEAFLVLDRLNGIYSVAYASKSVKGKKVEERILPLLMKENSDPQLAMLVVELVVTIARCVLGSKTRDSNAYRRVLKLVEQVGPWLRVLDDKVVEKLHGQLVACLNRCALFMVGEYTCFVGDLVHTFCMAAFTECLKSSAKDQFPKIARRISYSFFLQGDDGGYSLIVDILKCSLSSIACECKVAMWYCINDIIDLIFYCANKCRTVNTNICRVVAKHLNEAASDFLQGFAPVDLILSLYAAALYFKDNDVGSRGSKDECAVRSLLDNGANLQHIAALLASLGSYFHIACNENDVFPCCTEDDSTGTLCPVMDSDVQDSKICCHRHGKVSLFSFLSALEFLCKPFSEVVNTAKKHILSETAVDLCSDKLNYIQDAFHRFCEVFRICSRCRCTSATGRERFHESQKTLLCVAIAAFTVSIRTRKDIQRSADCIDQITSMKWIQIHELKYLLTSLYNIGVILYRSNQVKQASVALELCCRASWTCVSLLCKKFSANSEGIQEELSEDSIIEFVAETCGKNAFLLDVLHQCGSPDVDTSIVNSLLNWRTARNYLERLSGPTPLVQQWVKIKCKEFKGADVEDYAPTLYSLLLKTSPTWSKRTTGLILEEELFGYEEMNSRYPNICKKMQLKIIDILLFEVYLTKDDLLEKSRILIWKGRALRAFESEGLQNCIQCFSEAIYILDEVFAKSSVNSALTCHQLAIAHCLRALCTQEAEPNSEVILDDINHALELWSNVIIPRHCSADELCELMTKNAMQLLCQVSDLLSLKGHMHFHFDIYKLIIILLKQKNVPLEKSVAMLWADRRLSHALCMSPVDEDFILKFSKHFGVNFNSVGFWVNCLKDSEPLLVGFRQKFSLSHSIYPQGNHPENSLGSDINISRVKKAAMDLLSSIPVCSRSSFLAGHLYYDLCEKFISNGQLLEALRYAKEARHLRLKLLRKNFYFSIEHHPTNLSEIVEASQRNLKMYGSVATEVWPYAVNSWDLEGGPLSPWSVLQCYLESTLQVGIIYEAIGNGTEAEAVLLGGKHISSIQGLDLFMVAFASILGQIYRKRKIWDLAENELNVAKKTLSDGCTTISCKRCKLIMEATIDQQIGDLTRSRFICTTGGQINSLSIALDMYKSALEKLDFLEQENSSSTSGGPNIDSTRNRKTVVDVDYDVTSINACCVTDQSDTRKFCSVMVEDEESLGTKTKRGRKPRNASKHLHQDQNLKTDHNPRVTRSRDQSNHNKSVQAQGAAESRFSEHSIGNHGIASSEALRQKGSFIEFIMNSKAEIGCEQTCFCKVTNCWRSLLVEVAAAGSVKDLIIVKWEFHHRRLSVRLLTGIGKCIEAHGDIHEAHKVFWKSISFLFGRKPFCQTYSCTSHSLLLDFIGKEIPDDCFSIERAAVLYNICWFSVKNYHSEHTRAGRAGCCDLSHIPASRIVSWLLQAFILCRELPSLFQKVSRLLAAIFLLSTSPGFGSLPICISDTLSVSHWAAYFHQASLGTHLNHQFFSSKSGKSKTQDSTDFEGPHASGSDSTMPENYFRHVPEKVEYLEEYVTDFFQGLPSTTVICISLLGGGYASLLREMLHFPSTFPAWMQLSRLNSKCHPIVMLLPVNLVSEATLDDDALSNIQSIPECINSSKTWHCPWDYTVVDDVAPVFKLILEENYLSTVSPPIDTNENRLLWWTRRRKLDSCLGQFLRDIEDSWLGPWKCLLLGERSDSKHLDSVLTKLMDDLKRKCEFDLHGNLLRVILGGAGCISGTEACVSQLLLHNGYFGWGGCCGEEISGSLSFPSAEFKSKSGLTRQLIVEAAIEVEEECSSREPIILVLDSEVQMLPWESMPILRQQEVYRMPSVAGIYAILKTSYRREEQVQKVASDFPLIDPLDAFYLLNPSGDLIHTQADFEGWFRNQKFEGKIGMSPTTEELAMALKSHDLFIYFGHGSGTQYIPGNEIQKLENCAATLLMGCSSGSLSLMGCYAPEGAPIWYLLAGSPVIVGNLWEVTDKDIDRFGKAMLGAWLQERSTSINCSHCNLLVKEFGSMDISKSRSNAKKVSRRKKSEEASCSKTCRTCSGPRPKIGSFMSQAREACTLPFLIGASPVCYGVPTVIGKKKDL
ncbi:separase isoform X2 [Macadamia integrifolia]|uniref:separase isoform X2 n=1 Tax=Macadamia integrifolia TaxID=60698 RepID=UPI001C4F9F31|nr:separase isoform X2 [Macadamia integrifolia]